MAHTPARGPRRDSALLALGLRLHPGACVGTLRGWSPGLCPYQGRLHRHPRPGRWEALFEGYSRPSPNLHALTHPSPATTLSLDSLEPNHRYPGRHAAPIFRFKAWDPHLRLQRQRLPPTHTHTSTPQCQDTARRGQAGMAPAGPSLKEASCGAGLVRRLCQKGLMLPTGSWEGRWEWPSSGGPHPQPRAKSPC